MLQGLGEPIRELREFVKDVRFRNAQERQLGQLEVLDRRLELADKYGLLDTPEARAATLTLLRDPEQDEGTLEPGPRELPRGRS